MTKRKGERGSPWGMPREGDKGREVTPLKRMGKKVEEVSFKIQFTQISMKPKARKTNLMYFQLRVSMDLKKSSLMRIIGKPEVFKEWVTSWVRITLSRIFHPST